MQCRSETRTLATTAQLSATQVSWNTTCSPCLNGGHEQCQRAFVLHLSLFPNFQGLGPSSQVILRRPRTAA
eukprot:753261-Hanusia_phi.AAC.2